MHSSSVKKNIKNQVPGRILLHAALEHLPWALDTCTFPSYHKLPLRYPSFPAVVACQHKQKKEINRNDSTFLSFTTLFFTLLLPLQNSTENVYTCTWRHRQMYHHIQFIYKKQVLLSDCAKTLPQPHWRCLQHLCPSSGQAASQDLCSDTAAAENGAGLQVPCSVLGTAALTLSQSLLWGEGPSRQSLGTQPFSTPCTNCHTTPWPVVVTSRYAQ